MGIRKGGMTQRQKAFAEHYARTGDREHAAAKAGYAAPDVSGTQNLAVPAVQAEIARQQISVLYREALPAAVACLVSIVRSDKAPAGARVQASKVILDRTLGADDPARHKEPHEMTPDELATAIAALERAAADKARPVIEHEPEQGDIFG